MEQALVQPKGRGKWRPGHGWRGLQGESITSQWPAALISNGPWLVLCKAGQSDFRWKNFSSATTSTRVDVSMLLLTITPPTAPVEGLAFMHVTFHFWCGSIPELVTILWWKFVELYASISYLFSWKIWWFDGMPFFFPHFSYQLFLVFGCTHRRARLKYAALTVDSLYLKTYPVWWNIPWSFFKKIT